MHRLSVARSFADPGLHGVRVLSAHVPAHTVLIHQGTRHHNTFLHEREFTVGRGPMHNVQIVQLDPHHA